MNQSFTRWHKLLIDGTSSGRSNERCPKSSGQDQGIILHLNVATLAIGFLRIHSVNVAAGSP